MSGCGENQKINYEAQRGRTQRHINLPLSLAQPVDELDRSLEMQRRFDFLREQIARLRRLLFGDTRDATMDDVEKSAD
jgi:hypothetical protein